MSWRPTYRGSKFRNVYGKVGNREHCFDGIPITKNVHDNHFCAVNSKFVAVVTESAGGGSFIVIPVTQVRAPLHSWHAVCVFVFPRRVIFHLLPHPSLFIYYLDQDIEFLANANSQLQSLPGLFHNIAVQIKHALIIKTILYNSIIQESNVVFINSLIDIHWYTAIK